MKRVAKRGAGEHRAPAVHVDSGPPLREPDVRETVMEVRAVRLVQRTPVLQPLGEDERRVHDRHGEHDQREEQGDGGRRFQEALHRERRENEAEQERSGVAHEDPGRIEVVAQEPEARSGHDRREDRRLRVAQRERDHGKRRAGDRTDPRGETIHPVEEIDHVHDRDDPDEGQGDADPDGEVLDAEEGEREAVDRDPEADRDRGGEALAPELRPPVQAAEVVDDPDTGRDRGSEQDSPVRPVQLQEGERRHEDAEQERDPAQAGDRPDVQAPPLTRLVDDAEDAREAPDRRRQNEDDAERDQEAPEDFRVVSKGLPHASGDYFVPYRRSPASPRPGTM